jgi:hypothetical protein
VAALLRPGNAGSNTAADHITTTRLALAQLPKRHRRGRSTLIRTDSAGGTHEFLNWLTARGRWLSYSVGMTITDAIHHAVLQVPATAWTPAVEPGGQVRDGAWVAELAGDVLTSWPAGMRLIVRKERPHRGASCGSPPPPAWSPPAASASSASTATGPGPTGSPAHSPGWKPYQTQRSLRRSRQVLRVATVGSTRARVLACERFTACWPSERFSHRPR